jgi:RNA polymerase sigma factor (sigma-70 family)
MRLSPEAEVRLIVRAQKGDKRAIAELLSLCEPLMRKTAGKWTIAGHDDDDKYSICLLAFDRAVKGFDATRGSSRLSTTLTYSLLNLFDHAKRHAEGSNANSKEQKKGLVRAVQFSQLGDEASHHLDKSDESAVVPFEHVELLESNEELQCAVKKLTPRERKIFVLRLEGKTMDDIAITLGISAATVSGVLSNIPHKIQSKIESRRRFQQLNATRENLPTNLHSADAEEHLTWREKQVLVMFIDEKLSEAQIAKRLSVSKCHVNVTKNNGLYKLRCLEDPQKRQMYFAMRPWATDFGKVVMFPKKDMNQTAFDIVKKATEST